MRTFALTRRSMQGILAALACVVTVQVMYEVTVLKPDAFHSFTTTTLTDSDQPTLSIWQQRDESRNVSDLVAELTAALRVKLDLVKDTPPIAPELFTKTCSGHNLTGFDDSNTALRTQLPASLQERVESLVSLPRHMPIPPQVWSAMAHMQSQVNGTHELIIASAASSNHFDEFQAMLQNLHEVVFPVIKNVKFLVYDLGLTSLQRALMQKRCAMCTVLSFPFEKLPAHFRRMKCFSWKALILASHLQQAGVLIWADTSVRWTTGSGLQAMVQRTTTRGIQQLSSLWGKSNRCTLTSMFQHFGDSPCSHGNHIIQSNGCYGMYHNEPLVWHLFIRPLLSCASHSFCICPFPFRKYRGCSSKDPNRLAVCHRQDQSAISIIMARMFREHYDQFSVDMPKGILNCKRGDVSIGVRETSSVGGLWRGFAQIFS